MFVSWEWLRKTPEGPRKGLNFKIWLDLLPRISAKGWRFFDMRAISSPKKSNCDCLVMKIWASSMSACQSSFGWRIGLSSLFIRKSLFTLRMCPHLMRHFPRPLANFETEKCLGCKPVNKSRSTFLRCSVERKIVCLSSLLSSFWTIFDFGHSEISDQRKAGPSHHNWQSRSSVIEIGRVPLSAGLMTPGTWSHWRGSVKVWISPTQWAT